MANKIQLQQISDVCPEQYYAHKGSQCIGYIRLRWGHLTCDYLPKGKFTENDIRVLDHQFDDEYKGSFDSDEERKEWLDKCEGALLKYNELRNELRNERKKKK